MKKLSSSLLLGSFFISSAVAQSSNLDRNASERLNHITHEFILRQLTDQPTRAETEAAKRREAEYRENQFIEKTSAFVQLWSQFATEYNEKGAFNLKLAQEISKAFHELERSEGWQKVDRRLADFGLHSSSPRSG
jgi:hypothetical protein